MAKAKVKAVKAKVKNGVAKCKVAISHPMMTYNQAKKKTGSADNALFITHITGNVNGETVLDVSTSQFFSKNPIFKFEFKADNLKKGDKLEIVAVDNKGNKYSKKGKIKGLK